MAKQILRGNPGLNVNWKHPSILEDHNPAIVTAAKQGHDAIISILLAHPDIDPNAGGDSDTKAMHQACWFGRTSCARVLLQDRRVSVSAPDYYGRTPSWYTASFHGHLEPIKWWIASGREMNMRGRPEDEKTDAIRQAKKDMRTELVTLLENFQKNPDQTRREIGDELGVTGKFLFLNSQTRPQLLLTPPLTNRVPCAHLTQTTNERGIPCLFGLAPPPPLFRVLCGC